MKLLVDVCCGICLLGVFPQIENSNSYYFFSGDNICCEEEYSKRKDVFIKVCQYYNIKNWYIVPYNHLSYIRFIQGYEKEKEGGFRCQLCFEYRFENLIKNTNDLKINDEKEIFFSTTLSISKYKDYQKIFLSGNKISDKYNKKFKFYEKNFRDEKFYLNGIRIAKELNLYRQKFCGCEFSK